jgi:hypothetical protein
MADVSTPEKETGIARLSSTEPEDAFDVFVAEVPFKNGAKDPVCPCAMPSLPVCAEVPDESPAADGVGAEADTGCALVASVVAAWMIADGANWLALCDGTVDVDSLLTVTRLAPLA